MKLGRYIVGLISGLTFGMLFAPKKGKELRKELSKLKSKKDDPCGACHDGITVLGKAFKDAGKAEDPHGLRDADSVIRHRRRLQPQRGRIPRRVGGHRRLA